MLHLVEYCNAGLLVPRGLHTLKSCQNPGVNTQQENHQSLYKFYFDKILVIWIQITLVEKSLLIVLGQKASQSEVELYGPVLLVVCNITNKGFPI